MSGPSSSGAWPQSPVQSGASKTQARPAERQPPLLHAGQATWLVRDLLLAEDGAAVPADCAHTLHLPHACIHTKVHGISHGTYRRQTTTCAQTMRHQAPARRPGEQARAQHGMPGHASARARPRRGARCACGAWWAWSCWPTWCCWACWASGCGAAAAWPASSSAACAARPPPAPLHPLWGLLGSGLRRSGGVAGIFQRGVRGPSPAPAAAPLRARRSTAAWPARAVWAQPPGLCSLLGKGPCGHVHVPDV